MSTRDQEKNCGYVCEDFILFIVFLVREIFPCMVRLVTTSRERVFFITNVSHECLLLPTERTVILLLVEIRNPRRKWRILSQPKILVEKNLVESSFPNVLRNRSRMCCEIAMIVPVHSLAHPTPRPQKILPQVLLDTHRCRMILTRLVVALPHKLCELAQTGAVDL